MPVTHDIRRELRRAAEGLFERYFEQVFATESYEFEVHADVRLGLAAREWKEGLTLVTLGPSADEHDEHLEVVRRRSIWPGASWRDEQSVEDAARAVENRLRAFANRAQQ